MITINGNKYAKNESEFIDSLFEQGNTCDGFYKRKSNGIELYNMQNELFAFIVNNKHNEQFFVSASELSNGKKWYSYSLTTQAEKILGMDKISYAEQQQLAQQLTQGS
jgi:hypothetical protein